MENITNDLLDPEVDVRIPSAVDRLAAAIEKTRNRQGRSDSSRTADDPPPQLPTPFELTARLSEARPFELPTFEEEDALAEASLARTPEAIEAQELELQIELGRVDLSTEALALLREGAVVPLDKSAGDPVDIVIAGRLIARGEVLVLDDRFCVRIAEVLGAAQAVSERIPKENRGSEG